MPVAVIIAATRSRSSPATSTSAIVITTETAADVRSRLVQASRLVRPRTPSPSGATTATAAGSSPATGHMNAITAAKAATEMSATFAFVEHHQRRANFVADPAR